MKSDFLIAITQLSAEKNLPKEVVIEAIEAALVSAYRKNNFTANQNISVKINPTTGGVKVWAEKTVVELPSDSRSELSLDEARRIKADAQIDDVIEVEATPRNAGRIAAQTAKQVIMQRLHEAEHSAIFEEYANKEGDIITGIVQRIESRQIFIDLGRTEAVLPVVEQVRSERYRIGQRLKVYLLEVVRSGKGPQLVVSRSHPNLLRRLFELEVPEVFNGIVEIKSVTREAGYRSKVAVAACQEGVDPVGCCVGLRGIRIQNIVGELNGEKIDVVMWDPDASVFITNALSPARVLEVELDDTEGVATVVVPDQQLSLAIGKEGQNARLAAKLTGWRIDIKSASDAEAEKVAEAKLSTEAEEEVVVGEELPTEIPATADSTSVFAESVEEAAEPLPALEEVPFEPPEPQAAIEKPPIRFAEDILVSVPAKPEAKSKKRKKKSTQGKKTTDDGIRLKKLRRESEIDVDIGDEEY
ncbi:MAG TPA: transcription termination/antitermination protein NusA [Dehalococcoidia bacterium]|nr:transcription termination/antitermination protein NusA [Dehalococcoidia bacterium]